MSSRTPSQILEEAYQRAEANLAVPIVNAAEIEARIDFVARNLGNRAGVRLLLSSSLAKIDRPSVDIRQPYTEDGGSETYSGRTYDEMYVTAFVVAHGLPCNPTTAYLTPALRNRSGILTPETVIIGRPVRMYEAILQLLTDVYAGRISAEDLLAETIRCLIIYRNEQQQRMETLLASLNTGAEAKLSAEAIVTLIQQHLVTKGASRLPVLIVAAAYQAATAQLGERNLPLLSHNAADRQTGALGDVEITLLDDENIVTAYEMKLRRVTIDDINHAVEKIRSGTRVDNYIFITTDVIDANVQEYAARVYERTGGIEVVILDCIGFLRYFLHLFHRLRMEFIEAYQTLLLSEPDSAVGQPVKEAFLALRRAAESGE